MAGRTSRPGALIAARRLTCNPRTAFRAVSGLVLALFITTVAVVGITTQDAKDLMRWASPVTAAAVTDQLAATGIFTSSAEPAKIGPGRPRPPRRLRHSCAGSTASRG